MPLEIKYDKIVIGSSLEAFLFAFYGKHKILYTRQQIPDHLEKIEEYGLGTSKLDAWNKIAIQLSMGGYVPFENKIKHIRYVDANTLKVITHEETVCTIIFNKLYVFDDLNFLDLPPSLKTTSDKVKILDWFYAERGYLHDHDYIENKSDFMNQVVFFKNGRHKDSGHKDICVVSRCVQQDIDKYPEHLVRIKTENLMRKLGIETATKWKTYIKIIHMKRDIISYGQNIYENFDNVEFIYDDAKFIYQINQRRVKIDYMKYLRLKLGL